MIKKMMLLLTLALTMAWGHPLVAQIADPPDIPQEEQAITNAEDQTVVETAPVVTDAQVPVPIVETAVEIVQPDPPDIGWLAYLITTIILILLIPFVCQFVFMVLPVGGLTKQVIAWIVGILITFIFWILHIGFVAGQPALITLFYAWMCALAGNGLYDTGLLNWMRPKPKV